MFKNAIIYQFDDHITPQQIIDAVSEHRFVVCQPEKLSSAGFVPALHDWPDPVVNGRMVYLASDHIALFKLRIDSKVIPDSTIKEHITERVKELGESGVTLSKGAMKNLKEEIIEELAKVALIKTEYVNAYIDTRENILVVDTASQAKADLISGMLAMGIQDGRIFFPWCKNSELVIKSFGQWIRDDEAIPMGLAIGTSAKFIDYENGSITINNDIIARNDIVNLLDNGRVCTELSLVFAEESAWLTLTSNLTIKKIDRTAEQEDAVSVALMKFNLFIRCLRGIITDALKNMEDEES